MKCSDSLDEARVPLKRSSPSRLPKSKRYMILRFIKSGDPSWTGEKRRPRERETGCLRPHSPHSMGWARKLIVPKFSRRLCMGIRAGIGTCPLPIVESSTVEFNYPSPRHKLYSTFQGETSWGKSNVSIAQSWHTSIYTNRKPLQQDCTSTVWENSPRLAMDMPNYLVRQFGSAYSANYHTLLCAVKPFFLSLPGYRRSFLSYA